MKDITRAVNLTWKQPGHPPTVLRVTLAAILTAVVIFTAACGGEEPTATPPTATSAVAIATTPSPAETPTPITPPPAQAASPLTVTQVVTAVAAPPVGATDAISAAAPITGGLDSAATPGIACALQVSPDLSGREDLTAPLGCPLHEASYDPVAINEFGQGPAYDRFMLWFGSEQQIYVLFPDSSWLAYTDAWVEGEPEITCNPSGGPETSPPLPRRGFGKLWCTVEDVRRQMGEIDREERLCQHTVVQRFSEGRLLACYEDATIRYFSIRNDGTWAMEMVQ